LQPKNGNGRRHALYSEVISLLESENRPEIMRFVRSKLDSGAVDIPTMYTELLAPSLNDMTCGNDPETCIWREHVRSSLVRAVIETSYAYVLAEAGRRVTAPTHDKALVVCPTEEFHEIGARMAADFFTIAGYDVTFIGANTPCQVIRSAARQVRPKYLAISVTNSYNLFNARKVIAMVRSELGCDVIVVVGGSAFRRNPGSAKEVGADMEIHTFEEVLRLRERV
jgi:methylmalonyl-CoA mutase cobalamin-binding subunit